MTNLFSEVSEGLKENNNDLKPEIRIYTITSNKCQELHRWDFRISIKDYMCLRDVLQNNTLNELVVHNLIIILT